MADIDIKNINFKYVKVSGGASTIDVTMDDARFYKNKPDGYYKCFTFDDYGYSGYYREDLENLIKYEKNDIWDKTNRDTLLGFNINTKKLICNISAYMGLKDSDLKTDGEMPHPDQAGWCEMDLTANVSEGIIKLKQTDGSSIYLKVAPIFQNDISYFSGNACIEIAKKKVTQSNVIKKYDALWVKSPEDNSALMVYNCFKIDESYIEFKNNNKVFRNKGYDYKPYAQSLLYGKPAISFPDTGADQKTVSVCPSSSDVYIKNNTGVDQIEYTETDDLNSILNSGESINCILGLKDGSNLGHQYYIDAAKSVSKFTNEAKIVNDEGLTYKSYDGIAYENKFNPEVRYSLYSLDTKNKPVIYRKGISLRTEYKNGAIHITEDLPAGFVFVVYDRFRYNQRPKCYWLKKGLIVREIYTYTNKILNISDRGPHFSNDLFISNTDDNTSVELSKEDITSLKFGRGSGFVNANGIRFGSLVTVYKL